MGKPAFRKARASSNSSMDVIGLSSKRSRYVTVVGTGVESGGAGTDSHAGEGGATKSGATGAGNGVGAS